MNLRLFFYVLWTGILSVALTLAQQGSCPAVVEEALLTVGDNCTDMSRNSACYGYNRVDSTFFDMVEDDFFSVPADRADIHQIQTIETASLNLDNDEWGVAALRLQANLPNTLPGQGVVFMLFGETELESAIPPSEVEESVEPITATTIVGSNLRGGPSANTSVVTSVREGAELLADAISPDGNWLRVTYENSVAWIFRELVTVDADDLSTLPERSTLSRGPMQAVYLRTGVGQPGCEEVPEDTLLIQSPEGVKVDVTVNGAHIQLGSTILIHLVPPGDIMEIITLDGAGIIPVGGFTDEPLIVPPGFKTQVCLTPTEVEGESVLTASCDFSQPQPLTEEELEKWRLLEIINPEILNYEINFLTYQQLIAYVNIIRGGTTNTNTTQSSSQTGSCAIFSPLGGAPDAPVDFSWAGVDGATAYLVTVVDEFGAIGSTYVTTDTSIIINTGSAGVGSVFSWQVQALGEDNAVLCTATSGSIQRTGPLFVPEPVEPEVVAFEASHSCRSNFDGEVTNYFVTINWQANAGEPIRVEAANEFEETFIHNGAGPSGSVTFMSYDADFMFAEATNQATGETIVLFTDPSDCNGGAFFGE